MSDNDLELLARYARHRAEDAFAEIVRRHLGLVYSAALRQVRSPQLTELPIHRSQGRTIPIEPPRAFRPAFLPLVSERKSASLN